MIQIPFATVLPDFWYLLLMEPPHEDWYRPLHVALPGQWSYAAGCESLSYSHLYGEPRTIQAVFQLLQEPRWVQFASSPVVDSRRGGTLLQLPPTDRWAATGFGRYSSVVYAPVFLVHGAMGATHNVVWQTGL